MTPEERIVERYKVRAGSNRPLLSIRAMCVECFGGQPYGVADCPSRSCALWPFRMGKGNSGGWRWREARPDLGEHRGIWERQTQSIALEEEKTGNPLFEEAVS
jgi:hypothetical protein